MIFGLLSSSKLFEVRLQATALINISHDHDAAFGNKRVFTKP